MDLGLNGKTALVLGAGGGLGSAIAMTLAREGARTAIADIDPAALGQTAQAIAGAGGSALELPWDLADLAVIEPNVAKIEAAFGPVDILINNAGVALLGPSMAATEAEFDETFALNVKVPFFLVASLAPAMAERGWGSIVNVSTMVASFGQAGMALYGASRAALELLTKAWAAEYGPSGVRVNAVAPGPTRA